MTFRAAAMLVAVALLAAMPAPAHADGPDDAALREAARSVLSDGDYQKKRPTGELDLSPLMNSGDRPPSGIRMSRGRPPANLAGGGGISSAVMILLLVVLGAAIIFFIAQELVRARRRKASEAAGGQAIGVRTPGDDEVEDTMPATLDNARRLASAGRFTEAIHLLLRGALDYVAELARLTIEPSDTSRELLREAQLDEAAHGAFDDLVVSVELSLFGGVEPTGGDFERCASSFSHLHRQLHA